MKSMKTLTEATFVLDCSVTMAWCFEDEVTNYSEKIFDSLSQTKAIVPSLWLLEVANVLLIAQRKKRISKIQSIAFMDLLSQLPIQVDYASVDRAMSSIIEIAEETQLTIYDATYLELAIHTKLPLCTLDKSLKVAAKKLAVPLS